MRSERPYGIWFVNSLRSWGGAEVWMLETAAALVARGVRAGVIAQPGSELLVRARAAGVPAAPLAIRFDGAPWTLAKLRRLLLRMGATAVVANLTKDLKAAAVAGRLAGVPHILGSRESDFPLKRKAYYRWYFGHLATGLLVNSQATRRTVLDSAPWLDPARVHLLYKGIDTARFRPGGPPPAAGVVGFAGQLIPRKGVATLMAAWSRLEARPASPARLLRIAGRGPLDAELGAWRASLRHPHRVELPGQVEDMPAFYRGLDVLAMPSLSEGFGLAAAEAAACGVPVVAADASSLPEIVEHGRTGLLVPPGDADALAGALEMLTGDTERAAACGRAGRARIETAFPRDAALRRLLELTGGPCLPATEEPPCAT